ncbi:NADH-quinone oxidoreductase subunit NuoE [Serinicoccus kebangsaanensis]|uniref:NADH-quinone oxidoreductase subunit NuoE n=1 Tax=Serinicoccus kebangsaanensis TaxID=2602069 RepID=UPI001EE3A0A0|nr:NADH-quinone oxidoreductase subunit NuoE [Serinicoccus kebangsaanensis]
MGARTEDPHAHEQEDMRSQLEEATERRVHHSVAGHDDHGPLHHHTPLHASDEAYPEDVRAQLVADSELIIARYPQKRSALLPMLHLVQSVDGYVTGRGVQLCAELLDLTTAEVSGVATFYTQYKRHPNGEYTVGVCTNTLCAIMGGDQIFDEVSEHLGVGHDETTEDGKITLERVECNAACDFAPVVMVNWEFFDDQTPESTTALVDRLRAGEPVTPTRGPSRVCSFKQVSRVLAGFPDGLADEGPGAGEPSLRGTVLAREKGWTAPRPDSGTDTAPTPEGQAGGLAAGKHDSVNTDANEPDEIPTSEGVKDVDETTKGDDA